MQIPILFELPEQIQLRSSKVSEEYMQDLYQLHATRKYERETFWNGSQEYAAEKFGGGYYGEYVYIYHIE